MEEVNMNNKNINKEENNKVDNNSHNKEKYHNHDNKHNNKYHDEINKLNKKIKELEKENNELKEKNIRITSEMVNSLRRKDEENVRLIKYASEDLVKELLQTVDNFERALQTKTDNPDILNYQKGFTMIYNNLINLLNKFEVKEIDSLGKEFDPKIHQAVMTGYDKDKKENEVLEVLQKGYTYKDKVIRPAMVKVNKGEMNNE